MYSDIFSCAWPFFWFHTLSASKEYVEYWLGETNEGTKACEKRRELFWIQSAGVPFESSCQFNPLIRKQSGVLLLAPEFRSVDANFLCSLTNGIKSCGHSRVMTLTPKCICIKCVSYCCTMFLRDTFTQITLAELGSGFAQKGRHSTCSMAVTVAQIWLKLKVLTNFGKINPVTHSTKLFMYGSMDKDGSSSSVSIATELRAGRSGIESRWGRDFPPVQTSPGAYPASCKVGKGSFPGVKSGRGVLLTTHPLLAPQSWKSRDIPLPTLWATPGL